MAIEIPLAASLASVATVMAAAQEPWWIIGSAAVALHGADPGRIGDIDVLLGIDDASRLLPSIGIEPRRGTDHPDFRSTVFGTGTMTPLPVEFMAGFRHRSKGGWHAVGFASREPVALGDVIVFVPGRQDLSAMLHRFGRPKDLMRADRLDASARRMI